MSDITEMIPESISDIEILERLTPLQNQSYVLPVGDDETHADVLERHTLEDILRGEPNTYLGSEFSENVNHYFAPGIYVRELHMDKGMILVGHRHSTETINTLLKGKVALIEDGKLIYREAPFTYVTPAKHRKAAYVIEDVIWQNVFSSDETDVEILEDILVEKSPALVEFEVQMELRKLIKEKEELSCL
tara:strand:+ start:270 stop:839 length:570 start_codon:yes stop_codon:yes gene_type:complete